MTGAGFRINTRQQPGYVAPPANHLSLNCVAVGVGIAQGNSFEVKPNMGLFFEIDFSALHCQIFRRHPQYYGSGSSNLSQRVVTGIQRGAACHKEAPAGGGCPVVRRHSGVHGHLDVNLGRVDAQALSDNLRKTRFCALSYFYNSRLKVDGAIAIKGQHCTGVCVGRHGRGLPQAGHRFGFDVAVLQNLSAALFPTQHPGYLLDAAFQVAGAFVQNALDRCGVARRYSVLQSQLDGIHVQGF